VDESGSKSEPYRWKTHAQQRKQKKREEIFETIKCSSCQFQE